MKWAVLSILSLLCLSGCATYLSQRPPIMEDKLGIAGKEVIGTLSTSADYRVVYVRLDPEAKLCAEASPDVAQQISSAIAAAARGKILGSADSAAEFGANFAAVAKQLFSRSQGVQFYRDGAFALCNLHLNNQIGDAVYVEEMRALRKDAFELIKLEVEKGREVIYDNPSWPNPTSPYPSGVPPVTSPKEPPPPAPASAP